MIDLGTARSVGAVNRFARAASLALRKMHRMDLRHLALACLDETTRNLEGPSTIGVAARFSSEDDAEVLSRDPPGR